MLMQKWFFSSVFFIFLRWNSLSSNSLPDNLSLPDPLDCTLTAGFTVKFFGEQHLGCLEIFKHVFCAACLTGHSHDAQAKC
ncbi:hypothetical protein BDV35DRAFT_374232 [Aspergillus flavus]|uniref:Secreted protein n=1 Tax=Aspergillus flavus TaxID=5059 RepID=A0A5N6GCV2_ASPFL|nr:hypothetical protein BDV35DRAFT_374232 [Aspergillus flavus]